VEVLGGGGGEDGGAVVVVVVFVDKQNMCVLVLLSIPRILGDRDRAGGISWRLPTRSFVWSRGVYIP
jgi:hypothetical protein